jgi:hypothetical protein
MLLFYVMEFQVLFIRNFYSTLKKNFLKESN